MNKLYFISLFCLSLLFASCGKDDIVDDSETSFSFKYTVDNTTGYVKTLQQHTQGNGFPVVIMADGYTQSDINSGTYHNAVAKAVNALFAVEPMTSLRSYFDIYEVQAASAESGITTEKRNTAFSTYFVSKNDVNINGNDTKIKNYAWYALKKNNTLLNNALVIILVNSDQYGGVTMLSISETTNDSIATGISIAFVPTGCKSNNVSYFEKTLQHEAIGHGIGKLADEYMQEYEAPSQQNINKYKQYQKLGAYLNTKYDSSSENIYDLGTLTISNTRYAICGHDMRPGDIGYLFANDDGYSYEDLVWTQGGFTYATPTTTPYTGSDNWFYGCYMLEKNFYRPSFFSLMNSIMREESFMFNALSRYAIYARVMKVARGSQGNIHNQDLQRSFMQFDTMRGLYSAAKGAARSKSKSHLSIQDTLPPLPAPIITLVD